VAAPSVVPAGPFIASDVVVIAHRFSGSALDCGQ
jgi:hypothetical protein